MLHTNDIFESVERKYISRGDMGTNQTQTLSGSGTNTLSTNTWPHLVWIRGTNILEYPPVFELHFKTNAGNVFVMAGSVVKVNNDYEDATQGIKASFQIESDLDANEEFGKYFSSCFYVGRVNIHNASTNFTFLADSSSLWVMTSHYLTKRDWETSKDRETLQDNVRRRYGDEFIRMPRHPLIYSDILAIFEYQQKANPKQRFSDYLDSAGTIASGVSLFVPGTGALYSKGVNFAVGIVKPEIQKQLLWDLVLHHANFVARGLPEIVKVPPNSAINGLVFFPKRGIPGYVDGHQVYISSFNSKQTALISGAMVSDRTAATSATLTTTQ